MAHHPPSPSPSPIDPWQRHGTHRLYELRAGELRAVSWIACAWELQAASCEISPGRLQHSSYDVKFYTSYDLRVHNLFTICLQKKLDFFENLWYNIYRKKKIIKFKKYLKFERRIIYE
jgi:hypothetical protein